MAFAAIAIGVCLACLGDFHRAKPDSAALGFGVAVIVHIASYRVGVTHFDGFIAAGVFHAESPDLGKA